MVPEVGRESVAAVRQSIAAMAKLTERLIASGAESVIMISPHAPLEIDSFVAYPGPDIYGDFSNFRAPETSVSATLDRELLTAVTASAATEGFRVSTLPDVPLDHGTAVPLYFLLRNGWHGNLVALGYSYLSNDDHVRFGRCIRKAVEGLGRRVGFIASGDLSHRLAPGAPAGFNSIAHAFDERVVAALRANDPQAIVGIDHDLRKLAGECGFRSMLVAIGASAGLPSSCEVMNYEAPFGVGYLVAQLIGKPGEASEDDLPGLARLAVETFVRTGEILQPPPAIGEVLSVPAPCFVSLKTLEGDLRGCIGTIEPDKETLAHEIIANAISAAMNDPRFEPVTESELTNLLYSVDVLRPPESTLMEKLDPAVYGVIVEDEAGARRGLLLPDIPGIVKAGQQIEIAARKAGIPSGTPLRLWRFRVERFREAEPP